MYIVKELLLNTEVIDVVAGSSGAPVALKACEALVRFKYVTYVDVRTETNVINKRRRTRVIVGLKKISDF
jgi:hypothetical protein